MPFKQRRRSPAFNPLWAPASRDFLEPMPTLALPTPLVDTAWLAAHLGHPDLRVVDASWYLPTAGRDARAEYAAGHIPGAVYADIDWLSVEGAPYPHTLPPPDHLARQLGSLGVGSAHAVVVYDASGQHFSAPRVWYMLRSLGHERVAVLDGGLGKWRAEGHPVTTNVPAPVPAQFTPRLEASRWRDLAAMRAIVATRSEQVADARSPGRFAATEPEPRPGVRGGHVPGARSVHYATLVGPDGRYLDAAALRARLTGAGLDLDAPITCSCGSGVTACTVALGLELAGARQVAVYDGSWTEWGSQPDTPVETGPAAA